MEADDAELREFVRPRRHLFVPYEDLVRARDALKRRIEQGKLKKNPLFIDLDDDAPAAAAEEQRQLEELRTKRREAEARLDRPGNITPDGRIMSIQVRTPFRSTDAGRGKQLITALGAVRAEVVAAHPGVQIGFTGGVITAVAEHAAIFGGMIASSVITGLLVSLVLALYFRSATLLVLLIGTLAVATTMVFGLAALTVGHLNAATAFLGAIIAGNGVNYGLLLIARYLEERRGHDPEEAMTRGIVGTLRPTAIASLGAAIAYGALAATSFRGFADFAVIGALGMLLCWVTTYVLLPALVLRWGRSTRIYRGRSTRRAHARDADRLPALAPGGRRRARARRGLGRAGRALHRRRSVRVRHQAAPLRGRGRRDRAPLDEHVGSQLRPWHHRAHGHRGRSARPGAADRGRAPRARRRPAARAADDRHGQLVPRSRARAAAREARRPRRAAEAAR